MREVEKPKKRKWVPDALKFAACGCLLVLAWWLWQRNLGPELREVFFPKPGPAAAQEPEAPRTSDAR